MTNDKPRLRQRWRNEIIQQDSQHNNIKQYREKIEFTRRSARLVVFWSFVSLCYTLGDLQISTSKNSFAPWGIKLEGITNDKIIILLFILTTYFLINFLFVAIKVHFMGKSTIVVKDMTSAGNHEDEYNRGIPFAMEDDDLSKDRARAEREKWWETWFVMIRYPAFGFLEYFLASTIFPLLLYVGSTIMLMHEILC